MTTFHSKIDECSLLVDLEPESLQTDGAHPFDGSDEERSPPDGTSSCKRQANPPMVHQGLHFRDGLRCIDMVLVYHDEDSNHGTKEEPEKTATQIKRENYIRELQRNGIEVEIETLKDVQDIEVHFVKLHATLDALRRKANEMLLKLPFAIHDNESDNSTTPGSCLSAKLYFKTNSEETESDILPPKQNYLLARFSEHNADKFVGKGEQFGTIDRIRIVQRILDETRFSEQRTDLGIQTLLYKKVFTDAYPLHDGPFDMKDNQQAKNDRQRLRYAWATLGKFFKHQPIGAIKAYLGASFGFYFAWLGFCIQMLLPAAVLGFMVLIYGIASTSFNGNSILSDICNISNNTRFVMCPGCDKECWYWHLSESCALARVAYWLDNDITVPFAIFMSIWSSFLTELWKRRQTKIACEWQTYNYLKHGEPSRPQYIAAVSTVHRDIVTGRLEQHIRITALCKQYAVVMSAVAFIFTLAVGAVMGVVAYLGAVYAILLTSGHRDFRNEARIIIDVTAGLLNLISINMISLAYRRIARYLTDRENLRTQSQWENSFAYKMFAYRFVNVYSVIFYIAFFKSDLIVGTPGHYIRFGTEREHGFRLQGCAISGCLLELCIQMAVIMFGQQLFQTIIEILKPFVTKWWNARKMKVHFNGQVQWEQDYYLAPVDNVLFWEYAESVLQLGFVMMFSAAFPLAPLFALMNGLVKIRVDAINFIRRQRRPSPRTVATIGVWQSILEHLSEFSVLINALVIGFTSDFIPKLVYRLSYSPDGTMNGYVDNSLSFYNTSMFPEFERPDISANHRDINYTPRFCRYRGYRELRGNQKYSKQHWHIMAMRFVFVFIFHNTISLLKKILEWIIPDEQEEVKIKRIKTIYMIKKLFKEEDTDQVDVDAHDEYTAEVF